MSLLAPLYLLGFLGLILPWLLHRFSHHEPPQQVFPTTRFLEPTRPPATSKRKLRYWPLLLLRVLFLTALCFLFAQPWLRSSNDTAKSEAVQLVIVDTSFSMRAGDRWAQASGALDAVLEELPASDSVQLFSYASELTSLTDIVNDRGAIKAAMTQIDPGFEAADFGELMRRLNQVAGNIKKPVSATFITDGQRSNLPVQMNTLLANRLKSFNVVSVNGPTPINYYLHAEARTSDTVTARVSVRVAAASVAETSSASSRKTVQVIMNERVLGTQEVMLSPGESRTIQFDALNLPGDTDALMNVAFAQADFLAEDDQVDIPVRGLSAINITMANIGSEPKDQARVFISTALESDGDARVEMLAVSAALAPNVRHAVVFIDDLAKVPDTITRFVIDGGNVLVLPKTLSTLTNSLNSAKASTITRVDQAHALALGDIDWFSTNFYTTPAFSLESNDRVLMSLDSGAPLLIERSIGELGRLLILNDELDGFNSDLPLQPAFVQLMQQVINYFDASNALPIELEVGKDLFLPANTQLLTPNGEPLLDIAALGSSNNIRIEQPGVYSVLGASSSEKLSAVLNSGESNLIGLSEDELNAWEIRHDANAQSDTKAIDGSATLSAVVTDVQDKETLWRWLLPALLLFLIAESLSANRFLWVRRDGL